MHKLTLAKLITLFLLMPGASIGFAQNAVWQEKLFPGHVTTGDVFPASASSPCAGGSEDAFDFSVPTYPRNFPACPENQATWCPKTGNGNCETCNDVQLPALALRNAVWYVHADLVPLMRDAQHKINFARRGLLVNQQFVLSSQSFDYPLDAGTSFTLGRRLGERTSLEGSYLGSYNWTDSAFVRNNDINILLGQGNLFSPFTNFGAIPQLGFDFNNFVQVDTTSHLENVEINLRHRPDMACSQWDVSFLYGIRYIHIGETLRYHSESAAPAPGGSITNEFVSPDNDMIGAQLGLSGHYLYSDKTWLDIDLKGAIYSNHARQRTVFDQVDSNGIATSFATTANRNDSAFSGDLRLLWNHQLLPRLTIRTGYQATWVASVATAVDNFQTNPDLLRLGPGIIRTSDTIAYHGPVLGITWVR
jgi:Putative beta barrel porin-7 (BBP7)